MGLLGKDHRNCSRDSFKLKTRKNSHNDQLCIWRVSCVHLGLIRGNRGKVATSAVTGLAQAQAPWGGARGGGTEPFQAGPLPPQAATLARPLGWYPSLTESSRPRRGQSGEGTTLGRAASARVWGVWQGHGFPTDVCAGGELERLQRV